MGVLFLLAVAIVGFASTEVPSLVITDPNSTSNSSNGISHSVSTGKVNGTQNTQNLQQTTPQTQMKQCTKCGGKGTIPCSNCGGTDKITCKICGGDGTYNYGGCFVGCQYCGGSGPGSPNFVRGSGKVDCPRCIDGQITCPMCNGAKEIPA